MLLELFCGTAGVCAQFRAMGGRALGIDHQLNRSRIKAAAVKLDLNCPWVRKMVMTELHSGRVHAVHLGPPCGTASRARHIPLKAKLRKSGAPSPRPLRSLKFPQGFPWLKGISRLRVEAANALYEFTAEVAWECLRQNIPFTIENPENSLFWSTQWIAPLVEIMFRNTIHACEFGSDFKKSTTFLSNFFLPRLNKQCSGEHKHKAWEIKQDPNGAWKFDTAKEAEYPRQLAYAVACSLMEEVQKQHGFDLDIHLEDFATKIVTAQQPRRARANLLLCEFKHKINVICDVQPPKVVTPDVQQPFQGVPVGSKLIDTHPVIAEGGESGRMKATFGVYFSPQEFVQKALSLKHPFDVPVLLDESNLRSIASTLAAGPFATAMRRVDTLKYYVMRGRELVADEKALHEGLDPSIRPVLASKRLLLFKEMLADAGVDDPNLFADMCNGFRLVGDLHPSGQFAQHWKPAALSVEQLRQTAVWAQHAVIGECKKIASDPEIALAVWEETIQQSGVDKQWVKGPFTSSEITSRLGPHWIPSRRFGVRQGGKIRPVDDFSQYLINSSTSCHEKIDLEGIDNIVSVARFFLGACDGAGVWRLPGEHGDPSGTLAGDWKSQDVSDLWGRCLDLKQAYKQLVRHKDDAWASVLAVFSPLDGQVYFFEAVALPFGAVSSVLAFNRAARAIRMILTNLFQLVVTNFFDDFCQLELGPLRVSAWRTAEAVLDLLGWSISQGDDKRKPFAKKFEILGAVIELPADGGGSILVSNKPSRVEQIAESVSDLISSKGAMVSRSVLESLKGRLLYAAGHTYGRCTQLACQLLHRFSGIGATVQVSTELLVALSASLSALRESRPRCIGRWVDVPPVLVFTDGAAEDDLQSVTHGAVLIDPLQDKRLVFGDAVPHVFVEFWKRQGKKQVISQAEMFPVVCAKLSWSEHLHGRSVLWFLDNESARVNFIRNYSPVLENFLLLHLNAKVDVRVDARHWYNRVPSKSNPADDASRLVFDSYPGFTKCFPDYKVLLESLVEFKQLVSDLEKG